MEITLLSRYRLLVLHADGELDQRAADELRRTIERELRRTGAVNIAIDFERVTFMDSAGIGMIIGRYKTVSALGGRIIIYGASASVIRLLKMAGIEQLVIISPTLQDGITELKRS